jgi:threonylcarbamoyladenosine tRNA methylthiotransferase MtaB
MHYSILTFGCRVNQADSLRLEEDLRSRGWTERSSEHADLVIVNTCSVTATADQGARQAIRRVARENPSARIVATGCYATRCGDEVASLPGVVQVIRNQDKENLFRFLSFGPSHATDARERSGAGDPTSECVGEFEGRHPSIEEGNGPCGAPIVPGVAGRTAFTLRVQTGCEQRCTYCIIPATRGASRSVAVETVVREVERVAASGFREIALTGVHLGSYGRDLSPRSSLLDLLIALERTTADVTFRISSLEPMDCPDEVVDLVARSGRFQPHFHLPLQHASDRMLRAMGRPYLLDDYRRLVDRIAERMASPSIGSDLIVGFPGETDGEFAANLEYLPSSPLTHLHVFPYSDRPGTVASRLGRKIGGVVVRERAAALRRIGADLARRFHDAQVGVERRGLTLEDGTLVVTDNYLKVRIPPGLSRNVRVIVRPVGNGLADLVSIDEDARPASGRPAPVPAISGATTR